MSQENQHKSSGLFAKVFYNLLDEDMSAGSGGVFGSFDSGPGDTYAPGDARIPFVLGGKKKRKRKSKKKRKTRKKRKSKKGKKRKVKEDFVIPKSNIDSSAVQRRPAVGRM
jgi:hypothetical protein